MSAADQQKDAVLPIQNVSTKPPLVPCKEDAKPPKTPKTSGRFERERTTSNSSIMDDEFYLQPRSSSRKSSTKSREGSCSRDNADSFRGSNGSLERETCFERRDVEEVRILEPQDGRRSAHELSQTEKRKSNKDRFQGGGGKRFSRSVGSKSSTLSLHNTKSHTSGAGAGGEDDMTGGGSSTPLLQR